MMDGLRIFDRVNLPEDAFLYASSELDDERLQCAIVRRLQLSRKLPVGAQGLFGERAQTGGTSFVETQLESCFDPGHDAFDWTCCARRSPLEPTGFPLCFKGEDGQRKGIFRGEVAVEGPGSEPGFLEHFVQGEPIAIVLLNGASGGAKEALGLVLLI
jgi:hypothetical protein